MTTYQQAVVDGSKIFYREDGPKDRPTILLLHRFPTSSHMFRNLIPALADRYHLVAPDLPGFGFSDAPDREGFRYSFQNLAKVIDRFTQTIGIDRYAIYVFDYGAPVGLRLALSHPERITAIISQNGNAYEEGLSQDWNPIQKYWKEPTPENRAALREFLKPEATKWQYVHGVQDTTLVAPEAYELDSALLARPGNDEIQLDLFLDYASNVALYPKFQEYFRTKRVPLLAVWGKNDPFFLPLAPKHSNGTTRAPRCVSSKPATSPWKRSRNCNCHSRFSRPQARWRRWEEEVNNATALAQKQALTNVQAIFWGGLVAGILDAADGVIAFGTQGLNPIQVLQYIASGVLGQSAFQGGLATAALGAAFHFTIAWMAAAVFVLATRRLEILKTYAVPAGLLYGAAVYFFMSYLVLPLSAVAESTFHLGLFLNGVIGHALFVGLPISLFARRVQ
jgi:pimeloyl-ACP methyl ester carboxylesterase